jgi:hypothetical protein
MIVRIYDHSYIILFKHYDKKIDKKKFKGVFHNFTQNTFGDELDLSCYLKTFLKLY